MLLAGSTRGSLSWQLKRLRTHNPFRIPEKERELRERLAEALPTTELHKPDWPDRLLEDVLSEDGRARFLSVLEWFTARIRASNPA